ncbi:bone morphogenetic protein 4 isoform X2 [Monomorium pharaonis]|uniref:bone morphogenetic protein 4 isoform X2 n=1 Tax=Monomorium pharaonis TaxID=307658 RepID=UPI001746636D|nr:bone morphogenetic protein 4 isoform X2 [Monomorium pharaonis]
MTVMTRGASCRFLVRLLSLSLLLLDVNAYPKSDLRTDEDRDDGIKQELEGLSWPFVQSTNENNLAPRREEALQKIQETLGIRSQNEDLAHRKVPPQFMMELYNTIADPSGITRGRNPYNARVVRSFVERDPSLSRFYFFNISVLETSESVLEAELHLYRKKTPPRNARSLTTAGSPYYLIRVYQVLDDCSLDLPDLHRLLSVRYVGAHASGWQIFNVKQAVLGWMSGEPNLGLLVTAQNLFENEVPVEFSRRSDYHHSRQPILVLFDDDSNGRTSGRPVVAPRYYEYGSQDDYNDSKDGRGKGSAHEKDAKENEKTDLEDNGAERYGRRKRQREVGGDQPEEVALVSRRESEFFQRQKRGRGSQGEEEEEDKAPRYGEPLEATRRRRRDATSNTRGRTTTSDGIVSKNRSRITRILTSMDIYERAAFRERLGQVARNRSANMGSSRRHRPARSTGNGHQSNNHPTGNATDECTKHELYVDFHDIGLSSSIIAPVGYSAYQCKGVCEPPLSQEQRPTNHATIQAIVHKMAKDVERPCCVPTKLLGTSILFYDDNENVVLKMYEDMIADRCGCR